MTLALLTIAACSGLNRARGAEEDWMPAWWPGRAVFYTALAVGLVAAVFGGLIYGAVFGAAFFVWGVGPWGHLIGLGRWSPQDRPPSKIEVFLLRVARGNIHGALFLRMLFALPGFIALAWCQEAIWIGGLAPVFAGLAVAAYEAAWRMRPANPIWIAELIVGALWGALIVSLA